MAGTSVAGCLSESAPRGLGQMEAGVAEQALGEGVEQEEKRATDTDDQALDERAHGRSLVRRK